MGGDDWFSAPSELSIVGSPVVGMPFACHDSVCMLMCTGPTVRAPSRKRCANAAGGLLMGTVNCTKHLVCSKGFQIVAKNVRPNRTRHQATPIRLSDRTERRLRLHPADASTSSPIIRTMERWESLSRQYAPCPCALGRFPRSACVARITSSRRTEPHVRSCASIMSCWRVRRVRLGGSGDI